MSDSEHEVSRMEVRFGEDFDGDGKQRIRGQFIVNSDQTNKRIEELQEETSRSFESMNFCIILTIEGGDNKKLGEIIDSLVDDREIQENEDIRNERFCRDLRKLIKLGLKLHHHAKEGKFFIRISPDESLAERLVEPVQMLLEAGLTELAKDQTNKVIIELLLNVNAKDIIKKVQAKDRIIVPILSQLKAKCELHLDKKLSEKLNEIISAFDEQLVQSPQLLFLKYFKKFDVHLTFDSTDELPEVIRQLVLPGKNCEEDSQKRRAVFSEEQKFLKKLIESMGKNITAELFIKDFAFFKIEIDSPGFSQLLLDYLGFTIKNL